MKHTEIRRRTVFETRTFNCILTLLLQLNASDDRGIDIVRNDIKTFASTRTVFAKGYKLVILDEADAMTNEAQSALRRGFLFFLFLFLQFSYFPLFLSVSLFHSRL